MFVTATNANVVIPVDPAIQPTILRLFKRVVKFFDYRIGQDFSGDALHLRLRLCLFQSVFELNLEVLSLANIGNGLIAHFLQRTLYGFTLGIEHALLERNVYVGLHFKKIIPVRVAGRAKRNGLTG
jgi:hypothetical protein